ncbi:MAG: SpoIIE family protein phosphatase [Bacteroidetes bacterium]|nr:SpoIIE family protein phosphatase [Bacteroidota bacterium]
MAKPLIICVDDERIVLDSLRSELSSNFGDRFSFEIADNGEEALQLISEANAEGIDIPVVISDQLMPGMKGDEFLIAVNKIYPDSKKILLTGQASAEAVGNAVNFARLYRYIAKPWEQNDLKLTVEEAARAFMLDKELASRIDMLNKLNKAAQQLSEQVSLIKLMEHVISLAIEHTHSARGTVIFTQGDTVRVGIRASRVDEVQTTLLPFEAADFGQHVPLTVFRKLQDEGGGPVVTSLAYKEEPWKEDRFIADNKLRSLYATKVGKHDMALYIFLESDNREQYTHITQEFLELYVKQVGICMDNAVLYDELEQKVAERTRELKELYENVQDSITYARRIQYAILPSQEHFLDLLPNYFVFYEPKDIVCGDFYWLNRKDGKILLAALDCTGHGVPGAFMSVLGNNLLNQIVIENGITSPKDILAELDNRIRKTLKQEANGNQDGMDVCMISINPADNTLTFAGAFRPLLHQRGAKLNELKPERQSLGGNLKDKVPFTNQSILLEKGDRIFLFSDGITDQMGGPDQRKYTTKRFTEHVEATHAIDFQQQCIQLQEAYFEWKGDYEQMDDVMLLAFEW